MKLLGILLCYNDGDLLEESIRYLLDQRHDLVVWDHGSTDETAEVIRRYSKELLETKFLPRSFDFYNLYPAMSQHIMQKYMGAYDWLSWPDQDEFLEGPTREKPYFEWLGEVYESSSNWIQFNNFNYWFTAEDDPSIRSTLERVRHYSLWPDCAPRIRSWRVSATNRRLFNHNPPRGFQWPRMFNLRHYPARTREQIAARIFRDRSELQRHGMNWHYDTMKERMQQLEIDPNKLRLDDGHSELIPIPTFPWRTLYGYGPNSSSPGRTDL